MSRYAASLSSFIKQHRVECCCFALFAVLALFGHYFHEPVYDEAQAWQIAKTASWHDIVLLIPIYEGHPPFWHLLLAVPAKWGLAWQIVHPIIGLTCMIASAFLIFFKAPFPRWVRCLLPFNFFLFYQYGIIVRPYAIMMLLILLLALWFPQKDKRPGLFVSLLMSLCMCHLFGIAIAGGITLAWLWEMKAGHSWTEYIPALFKDKRFHYMLGMLALVIGITLLLLTPRAGHTFVTTRARSILQQAVYIFMALPADAVLTNLNEETRTYSTLLAWKDLLVTAVLGVLLWVGTVLFLPRKKLLFLILPYACLGIMMLNYSSFHHIGLGLLLFVWYFWITLAQDAPLTTWPSVLTKFAKGLLLASLLLPASWSLYALYQDSTTSFLEGKQMVAFLKKYNLTNEVIFSAWQIDREKDNFMTNPEVQPLAVFLNMYLDHNIIANFHNAENKGYLLNTSVSAEQQKKIFAQWRQYGFPMVTLGMPALNLLYNDDKMDFTKLYRIAFVSEECEVRKFKKLCYPMNIYFHEKLWNKYGAQILAEHGIHPQIQGKPAAPADLNTPADRTFYK